MVTREQVNRGAVIAAAVALAAAALATAARASDPHAAAGAAQPQAAPAIAQPVIDAALPHGEALAGDLEPGGLLPADDADPWTRWFSALEGGSPAAGAVLYPLDAAAAAPGTAKPYRHLAIAKAVTRLEQSAKGPANGHGAAGSGHDQGHADGHEATASPLLALANARNYLNLSEYDQALAWYAQAGARDPEGHFRRETGREALAAAICARDTVAAGRAIANTMAAVDLSGRESEFVLAMRWLLGRRDGATLSWFVDRAAAPELAGDVRIAFWRAYSLSWLERRDEALGELDRLLAMGGREQVLGARERGWVLTAWADLTLLSGNRDAAEQRYRQLATSGTPALRDWGRLQSAAIAFVANRYGEAAAGFREICQAEAKGAWADHACAMADMASRLEKLLNEGERYGAAAHYGH